MIRRAVFIILFLCGGIVVQGSDPMLVRAQERLAKRLFDQGRYRDAYKEYDALLDLVDFDEVYKARFWRGNCSFFLRDYEEAKDDYVLVMKNYYTSADYRLKAHYNIVLCYYYKTKNAPTAMKKRAYAFACGESADAFIATYPNASTVPLATFYRADALFLAEEYARAKDAFTAFLATYPHADKNTRARKRLDEIADVINTYTKPVTTVTNTNTNTDVVTNEATNVVPMNTNTNTNANTNTSMPTQTITNVTRVVTNVVVTNVLTDAIAKKFDELETLEALLTEKARLLEKKAMLLDEKEETLLAIEEIGARIEVKKMLATNNAGTNTND